MSEKKTRRWWRRWYFIVLWVVLLLVVVRLTLLAPRDEGIIIGYDTTRIEGPLNDDGSINYVAALNEKYSRGVTKQNNAAVLLLQIFPIDQWLDEKYCRRVKEILDIPPPPPNATFFVGIREFAENQPLVEWPKRLEQCLTKPWSAKDEPVIAAWLKANEKPLALVVAASKRERYYYPLVSRSSPPRVMNILLPGLNVYRRVSKAIIARAMLKLKTGDVSQAWEDILSVHRLARLLGQDSTFLGRMVATVIEAIACEATCVLSKNKLSVDQAQKILNDLQGLKTVPYITVVVDESERMSILDFVMYAREKGLRYAFEGYYGGADEAETAWGVFGEAIKSWLLNLGSDKRVTSSPGALKVQLILLDGMDLDWNIILRMINEYFDRMVVACRIKNAAEVRKAVSELYGLTHELPVHTHELPVQMSTGKVLLYRLVGAPYKETLSRHVSEWMACLLIPSFTRGAQLQHRAEMQFQLAKVAMALAVHKAEKGTYPQKLDELKGPHLKEIPQDFFVDKPLIYKKTPKGYLLYSVGTNGRDDGGVRDGSFGKDDIVVQIGNHEDHKGHEEHVEDPP